MSVQLQEARAEKIRWCGHEVVSLAAGGWKAVLVPEVGGNLMELADERRGIQVLHSAPDFDTFKKRSRIFGIPVIFPPNRIRDGVFSTRYRTYTLPLNSPDGHHCHGIIGQEPWEVARVESGEGTAAVEVRYTNGKDSEFFKSFPHEFTFSNTYTLSEAGLVHEYRVTNRSPLPMPVGIGFHIAFNLPFNRKSVAANVRVRMSAGRRWEIDERTMPTGKLLALGELEGNYRKGGLTPVGFSIRDHYTADAFEHNGRRINAAILEDASVRQRIVYEAGQSFKHWMIWNDLGDKDYICPEPMTWVIDAPNLQLPRELTGYRELPPGESFGDRLSLRLEEY